MYRDFTKMTDTNLSNAYARNETWRTYTMEDECRRMYLSQELGAELQRRGLPFPKPIYLDDEC